MHFSVLVIGENFEEQLSKFNHDLNPDNKDSKWDWYEIGGRFENFFILKNGEFSDQALKKDIDWEATLLNNSKKLKEYFKQKSSSTSLFSLMHDDKTEEEFLDNHYYVYTHAIIKNGKWKELNKLIIYKNCKSHKKWSATWKKTVDSLPDDTLLTIIDCHI